MIRMMLTGICFVIALLMNISVWAHSSLEKSVVDVLTSDKFCIQFSSSYKPTGTAKQMQDAAGNKMEDLQYVQMLLKDGNTVALINDLYKNNKFQMSIASLYKDGCSYSFMTSGKKCYSESGYVLPKGTAGTKMENDMALKNFEMVFNSLVQNFLPFLPDENKTIDPYSGKEVAANYCNIFHKKTKELIGGKEMDVVEYRTPADMALEAIGRYYFVNDTIFQYVRYEKEKDVVLDKEWQDILGTTTYQYGGGHGLVVYKFTKDINNNFLQVPPKVKFHKIKMDVPSNMY